MKNVRKISFIELAFLSGIENAYCQGMKQDQMLQFYKASSERVPMESRRRLISEEKEDLIC